MGNVIQIGAQRSFEWDGLTLYIWRKVPGRSGRDFYEPDGTGHHRWVYRDNGDRAEAAFLLQHEPAAYLAETLSDAGAQPPRVIESKGHLAALEGHLGDMRKLVSHHTGVTL